MNSFEQYSNIILQAFLLHGKQQEVIERKQEIIAKISDSYNEDFQKILFVGFNPAIFALKNRDLYCIQIDQKGLDYLHSNKIKIKPLTAIKERFDLIFAVDEFFTFVNDENQQRELIKNFCSITNSCIVTTLKDYKNIDFKSREFSEPAIIRSENNMDSFTEIHNWNLNDRYSYETFTYHLKKNSAEHMGTFNRRTLFFKQLAKITSDAGSTNFLVHKNLMYKSLIKKNYEHVISIDFK
jgi:hypothetical protein